MTNTDRMDSTVVSDNNLYSSSDLAPSIFSPSAQPTPRTASDSADKFLPSVTLADSSSSRGNAIGDLQDIDYFAARATGLPDRASTLSLMQQCKSDTYKDFRPPLAIVDANYHALDTPPPVAPIPVPVQIPKPIPIPAPEPAPAQRQLESTGNFKVSLINDMVQVPVSGQLPDSPQNKVFAGKNDVQSVQIGIHAPDGGTLSNVDVSVSDLVGPNGAKLDSSNIGLFREHYVNVTKSSNDWQSGNPANPAEPKGWYADGLIPFIDPATGKPGVSPTKGLEGNHFSVAPGQNQPIWADIKVPKGTAAGDYHAVVTVNSDQGKVQVPLDLHVWNFEAPTKPYLTTSFNAIGNNDAAVQEALLDNKISPVVTDPAKEQKYLEQGLTGRGVGFYSGADYAHPHMSAAPGVDAINASKRAANPTNDPNLLMYDYSADEIGGHPQLYPQIKQWAQNMHAAGVNNLITMAPDQGLLSDGSGSGKPAVDVFAMLPEQYDKTSPALMQQFKQAGAKMWSYNTLIQDNYSPKWEIDFSPLNERQQAGFISQSNGLTGLLGWTVTNWSSDPWNNPYKTFQAGEGALVLPGRQAGLQSDAPTVRLKALRDGVGDYNYVQMLKNSGRGAIADQISHTVGLNFRNWSRDPQAVEKAHEEMGYEIERAAADQRR